MHLKLKCIKETKGFTIGKTYKLLGCGGEYVQLKDDNNEIVVLYESYFSLEQFCSVKERGYDDVGFC